LGWPSRFPGDVEDGDVAESRRHAAVAHRVDLRWLTLAVVERAAQPVRRRAADHVHRIPEHRRVALIGNVLQHAGNLAVADLVEGLPGELEVVALMVDRPRPTIS